MEHVLHKLCLSTHAPKHSGSMWFTILTCTWMLQAMLWSRPCSTSIKDDQKGGHDTQTKRCRKSRWILHVETDRYRFRQCSKRRTDAVKQWDIVEWVAAGPALYHIQMKYQRHTKQAHLMGTWQPWLAPHPEHLVYSTPASKDRHAGQLQAQMLCQDVCKQTCWWWA